MITEDRFGPGTVRLSGNCSSYHVYGYGGGPHTWGLPYQGPFNDALGYHLGVYEVLSRPIDLLYCTLRNSVEEEGVTYTYLGEKPWGYYTPTNILNKWSAFIANTKALFSDWDFKASEPPSLLGENPVTHFNVFGHVVGGLAKDGYDRSPVEGFYQTPVTAPAYSLVIHEDGPNVTVSPANRFFHPRSPIGYLHTNILRLKEEVDNGWWDGTQGYVTRGYKNFQYFNRGVEIYKISYDYDDWLDHPASPWYHKRHYSVIHEFLFIEDPTYLGPETESLMVNHVKFITRVTWDCTLDITREKGNPSSWMPTTSYAPSWLPPSKYTADIVDWPYWTHGTPSQGGLTSMIGWSAAKNGYLPAEARNFARFQAVGHQIAPDVLSLGFLACQDAVNEAFVKLESNHLETLLELGDVTAPVDLVKAAIWIAKNRKKGKLNLLFALLDLLADAKLTYSLGVAPTISDALDVAENCPRLLKTFGSSSLYDWQDVRGKYTVSVPDGLTSPFSDVHVTSRCKMRLRLRPDSLLSALMPVKSLGLLPSFSSLWDLIPGSFLLDWITKTSGSLEAVDTSLFLMAFDIAFCVNSFKLEYRFNDEDQNDHDFVVKVSDDFQSVAGYRLFCRYVSSVPPMLGPTRIPIWGEIGVPDWGLAGSLLYKGMR